MSATEQTAPSEALMLTLLRRRYSTIGQTGLTRYLTGAHVRDSASWARRVCDFMAVDTYQAGAGWDVRYPVHGHEVKVSRSDWLRELADPTKAEAFRRYCTHWWLVVPDAKIVRDDLPEGWGLMVAQGSRLVAKVQPAVAEPESMPRGMIAALCRAVANGADLRARADRVENGGNS